MAEAGDSIAYCFPRSWWKAKHKAEDGQEGAVGLIPATYVEEVSGLSGCQMSRSDTSQIPPLHQVKSIYAYESTSPEELSMAEDTTIHVYSVEEDWLLARVEGGSERLGFVPRTYCEAVDEAAAVEVVADSGEAEADLQAHRQEEEEAEQHRAAAEKQRLLKLKDKVETWSISELEGKKKKKGTLGVGNGAVFFASDTDKVSPPISTNHLLCGDLTTCVDERSQAIRHYRTILLLTAIIEKPRIDIFDLV